MQCRFDMLQFFFIHGFVEMNDKPVGLVVDGGIIANSFRDFPGQQFDFIFHEIFEAVEFSVVGEAKGAADVLNVFLYVFKAERSRAGFLSPPGRLICLHR